MGKLKRLNDQIEAKHTYVYIPVRERSAWEQERERKKDKAAVRIFRFLTQTVRGIIQKQYREQTYFYDYSDANTNV